MADSLNNLIVTGLEVENVKRLRVVRLKPGPGLVEVSGKNKNGKTSLLDSIAMAIGGKEQIPWSPIRNGETSATIKVDLGNEAGHQIRITRRLTARDNSEGGDTYTTSLKIEDADGKVPRGAQGLLDGLLNGISFDPEEFMSAKPAQQADILKGLVPDFDFAANAKARKAAFDARTESNRAHKQFKAQADGIDVAVGTPTEKVDASAFIAELSALGDKRAEIEQKRAKRQQFVDILERDEREAAALRERAVTLRKQAEEAEDNAAAIEGECAGKRKGMAEWPELIEPANGADLQAKIQEADRVNAEVAKAAQRAALERKAVDCENESLSLSRQIESLNIKRFEAIASADLPASGLALEDDRVMLRGVPFDQASQAEQIRTSLAIGMALNPRLKVMRVKQGNDLDDDAWKLIAEVALDEGMQIWVESIRAHGPNAIVLVDGEVK